MHTKNNKNSQNTSEVMHLFILTAIFTSYQTHFPLLSRDSLHLLEITGFQSQKWSPTVFLDPKLKSKYNI